MDTGGRARRKMGSACMDLRDNKSCRHRASRRISLWHSRDRFVRPLWVSPRQTLSFLRVYSPPSKNMLPMPHMRETTQNNSGTDVRPSLVGPIPAKIGRDLFVRWSRHQEDWPHRRTQRRSTSCQEDAPTRSQCVCRCCGVPPAQPTSATSTPVSVLGPRRRPMQGKTQKAAPTRLARRSADHACAAKKTGPLGLPQRRWIDGPVQLAPPRPRTTSTPASCSSGRRRPRGRSSWTSSTPAGRPSGASCAGTPWTSGSSTTSSSGGWRRKRRRSSPAVRQSSGEALEGR